MSLQMKEVEFNIGTGTSDVTVTGAGFTPLAALFFAIGRSESTDAGAGGDPNRMVGWAAATTQGGGIKQNVVCSRSEDNADSDGAEARHQPRTDACVAALASNGTEDGLASLQEFNSDGCVLNIDNQFSVNQRVLALFIGGGDISNIEIGSLSTPTTGAAPFAQDITTGFTCSDGEALLLLLGGTHDVDNDFGTGSALALGGAVSTGSQFNFVGSRRRNNATTSLALSALGRTLCYASHNGNHNALSRRATFNGWNPNGFQIQWEQISGQAARLYWMLIKGGKWAILDGVTATSLTTVALTGSGFTPVGGVVLGHMAAEDGGGASSIKSIDRCSFGVFTSSTSRRCVAQYDRHGVATTECGTRIEHDAVLMNIDQDGTLLGAGDVQSLDSDGVTLVMDDADPSAAFFVAILGGSTGGAAGSGTGVARRRRRR